MHGPPISKILNMNLTSCRPFGHCLMSFVKMGWAYVIIPVLAWRPVLALPRNWCRPWAGFNTDRVVVWLDVEMPMDFVSINKCLNNSSSKIFYHTVQNLTLKLFPAPTNVHAGDQLEPRYKKCVKNYVSFYSIVYLILCFSRTQGNEDKRRVKQLHAIR